MEPSGVKRKLSVILAMFRRVASGMSEAPDKPEDQPSGQPQPDEEERPQLRKVPEDELRQVLEAHDKWVQSEGKEGEQANLEEANLRQAELQGTNLKFANGLTQKQLDYACGNAKTKLPPNLSIKRCP